MFHIKEMLGNSLEKYFPRLYCVQHVVRHAKDVQYAQKVRNVETASKEPIFWRDPRCVYIEHLGKRNPGKTVYLFQEQDYSGGFCTVYHRLLLALAYADNFGMLPVIFWDGAKLKYSGEKHFGENAIERFFDPVSPLTIEQALVSKNIVMGVPVHLCMNIAKPFERHHTTEEELNTCANAQKKYIRLKADISAEIEKARKSLLQGNSVLGIHLGGTVFNWGVKGYPVPTDFSEWKSAIERVMQNGNYEKLFVATDDQAVFDMMIDSFGEKVLSYDKCCRANGSVPLYLIDNQQPNFHERLAFEALRDIYTLANCDGLVTDLGQVGFLAQVVKKAHDETFKDLQVMDRGYYEESTPFAESQICRLQKMGKQL